MTQCDQILEMLQCGPVTALDALQEAGCFRLAARIHDLRQRGVEIESRDRRLGNGKHIAEYRLAEKQMRLPW
jgi:hypothetical protein